MNRINRCLGYTLAISLAAMIGGCGGGHVAPPAKVVPGWEAGGTLHKKTALEWQQAAYADKLATCGDFICGLWVSKKLTPGFQNSIKGIDDVKPHAERLVEEIDAATQKETDEQQNKETFANQEVAIIATACLVRLKMLELSSFRSGK